MFGESESESPRVPSPWDSLISTPPEPSSRASSASPSSLTVELIPRLIPENDEGNVEYKLQLLSPSPARFARLVTQLKWRLLEGGGQAYYELGVADSGALVGLPRAELEQSLETLEMMAGEIGASVIVVKEIEVPAVMAGLAASQTDKWNGQRKQRAIPPGSEISSTSLFSSTETESTTDLDSDDIGEMSNTIVLEKANIGYSNGSSPGLPPSVTSSSSVSLFPMDSEPDPTEIADGDSARLQPPYIAVDLEIASVFKPRPMRVRMQTHTHTHLLSGPARTKRLKKIKHITHPNSISDAEQVDAPRSTTNAGKAKHHVRVHGNTGDSEFNKAHSRRAARDRKREEKRQALAAAAFPTGTSGRSSDPISPSYHSSIRPLVTNENPPHKSSEAETSALITGLADLHVSMDDLAHLHPSHSHVDANSLPDNDEDDCDIFGFPPEATPVEFPTPTGIKAEKTVEGQTLSRLIVEALVVRKMSLDEAFLDFGGFAMI